MDEIDKLEIKGVLNITELLALQNALIILLNKSNFDDNTRKRYIIEFIETENIFNKKIYVFRKIYNLINLKDG